MSMKYLIGVDGGSQSSKAVSYTHLNAGNLMQRTRCYYFNDPAFEPSNTLCSARVLPNFGCYTNQTSQLYGSTYTHVFSPSLVNEFRAGMGRLVQPRTMQDTNINFNATYGINAFNGATTNNTGVPPASITGYATIGGATNLPQKRYDDHFILGDALIWTHDKHTIKYGADRCV